MKIKPLFDRVLVEPLEKENTTKSGLVLSCEEDKEVANIGKIVAVGDGLLELINPEITKVEGEQVGEEGCLSLPGLCGMVKRPKIVQVKAQNREGKWCLYKGEDLKARCFCHELDHLDGILYKDNLLEGTMLQRVGEIEEVE